ncbi:hypothetical protein JCM30471_08780 [Desulfuromonas carbonis]|uniref:hypothetical protein n=1 Tax=Desulfuromonas sp. DDH964 TaxID=1823759 RepID=UPI00078DB124|nr:hypothetical protein [Desulfuromonas sp. DDH964]AMV72371.1 hypothetical protein DBW_2027 [Desulfuromonas sp. DDH964]
MTPAHGDLRQTASPGIADKTCSIQSAIKGIEHRCTGRRQRYTLDGEVFGNFQLFLEAVFNRPLAEIVYAFYIENQMSSLDIHKAFSNAFGFEVSERTISTVIKNSGVKIRDRAETKSLAWKQGKMAGSMARSRQSRKLAYLLGSRAEQKIRYLLREALMALDVKWDVVIGDNLQHIHERFEIDIPVVLIDRGTGRACRIAIEVDSAYTHSSMEVRDRDTRKDISLKKAG